jgi:hypothetical protein
MNDVDPKIDVKKPPKKIRGSLRKVNTGARPETKVLSFTTSILPVAFETSSAGSSRRGQFTTSDVVCSAPPKRRLELLNYNWETNASKFSGGKGSAVKRMKEGMLGIQGAQDDAFINKLRMYNGIYNTNTQRFMSAKGLLSGKRVLIVGSGSDKRMLKYFSYDPECIHFVDSCQEVCETLHAFLSSKGVFQFEVFCDDAFNHMSSRGDYYDTVVCLQATGQLCFVGNDTVGNVEKLYRMVFNTLRRGGSFLVDELYQRDFDVEPTELISDFVKRLPVKAQKGATSFGKYNDSIVHDVKHFSSRAGFILEISWLPVYRTSETISMGCVWDQFLLSKPYTLNREQFASPSVHSQMKIDGLLPIIGACVGSSDLFERFYPKARNGVKDKVSNDYYGSADYGNAFFKYDGESAVVVINGARLLVITPTRMWTQSVQGAFKKLTIMAGECLTTGYGCLVMVSGFSVLNGDEVDCNSRDILSANREMFTMLSAKGIYASVRPANFECVQEDSVVAHYEDKLVGLAIDGLVYEDSFGVPRYLKPTSKYTLDCVNPQKDISKAFRHLDINVPSLKYPVIGTGTSELMITKDFSEVVLVRQRPDKQGGSNPVKNALSLLNYLSAIRIQWPNNFKDLILFLRGLP